MKPLSLVHPCPGQRVSQWFGVNAAGYAAYGLPGHEGLDFACPVGTPIRAMHGGVVTVAAFGSVYGSQVWIAGAPLTSLYAHLSELRVGSYQAVAQGQVIGLSGDTGRSSGPHLHLGLKVAGIATAFNDWVDPGLFLRDGVWLGSKLSFHVQRPAYPQTLRGQVAASGVWAVKVMDPDKGEASPFGDLVYIGRLHFGAGEPDKETIWRGAAGADEWWAMAWPRMQAAPWVRIWEGPNEPGVDTPEKARLFAAFELRRIALLHGQGLLAASGVFSTGNILLELWPLLREVLAATDYLALHEYGMKTERPQMGRTAWNLWHLYRHEKVIATLRTNDCRVPPILLTETGIDYAGNPQQDGWRAQGLSPEAFAAQLEDAVEGLPPEVLLTTPFTCEPDGWPSFDMGGRLSELLTAYLATQNGGGMPSTDWLTWARTHKIRYNPAAALSRAILAAGQLPLSQEFSDDGGVYQWGLAEAAQRWHLWRWTPQHGVVDMYDEAVE